MIETLFDGIVGAVVGAGVAVWVLLVSQRAQSKALAEQLTEQARNLSAQLQAQQSENAVNRINNTSAELFAALTAIPKARATEESHLDVDGAAFISCFRLRLDLTDDEDETFGNLLDNWINHFCYSPISDFLEPGEEPNEFGTAPLNMQVGWVMRTVHEWLRAKSDARPALTQELLDSYRMSKNNGPSAWRGTYKSRTNRI